MRKTIYVKDEELWRNVEDTARVLGISVSQYLLSFHGGDDRLGRIEAKLDRCLGEVEPVREPVKTTHPNVKDVYFKPGAVVEVEDFGKGVVLDKPVKQGIFKDITEPLHSDKSDDEVIAEAQERLDLRRLGYSKERQLGKR